MEISAQEKVEQNLSRRIDLCHGSRGIWLPSVHNEIPEPRSDGYLFRLGRACAIYGQNLGRHVWGRRK